MKSTHSSIMSDEEVLKELVKYYDLTHYNNSIAIFGVTEKLIVEYISESYVKKLELSRSWKDIVGHSVLDLIRLVRPEDAVQKVNGILRRVVKDKVEYESIAINSNRSPENVILKHKLTPLFNRFTGNIIAIEDTISSYKPSSLLYSNGKLFAPRQSDTELNKKISLSARESEVLFLNCYCKSAKEVAAVLSKRYNKNISLHSVNTINRRLYVKFDVYNLESLIEIAYQYGYHIKIPASLIEENIISLGF